MDALSLDFETRSTINLRNTGVYPYAEHPTTDVWCMAYAFGDEDVQLWVRGDPVPARVSKWVTDGGELRAWNVGFERVIWREIMGPVYGFPDVAIHQWVDTMAEAAAMALPRGLDKCAEVLKVRERKDKEGYALMMRMTRPRSTKKGIVWWEDEDRLHRLYEYCKQDVRVERAIARRVRRLPKSEQVIFLLDQKINDRGVRIDTALVAKMQRIVDHGLEKANAQISELTDGDVDKVTKAADLTRWLQYQGVGVDNVKKSTVRDILEDDGLGGTIRKVLEIRAEGARSSVSKLKTTQDYLCRDERARGLLAYHGAGTGRWAGKGIQPQNFPRGEVKNVERFLPLIMAGDFAGIEAEEPALVVVSSLLRGIFVASPGNRLLVGDYNAIEARVLAWLAGQTDLVHAFATGANVYGQMAARIYGGEASDYPKGSDEREVGKVVVLGAGYGMGHKKHRTQLAEQTGIKISAEEAKRNIDVYRAVNKRIKQYWWALENAAFDAVTTPGGVFTAGVGATVRYTQRGSYLWCVLPSGRALAYRNPRIVPRETPWGETRMSVQIMGTDSYTRKWVPIHLYGGLLTENVVQAVSRDILAAAMVRLEVKGYPVVLSVHDEIVCDVPASHGALDDFLKLMERRPKWAATCPVAVEAWEGERYKK